jgi:hypothetical protein
VTRIGVAFISDRDGHLPACMESFSQFLVPSICSVPSTVIDDRQHHLGLAGAARAAWQWAVDHDFDYLLHVEEDFRLVSPFHLNDAVGILETDKYLAQVVLKRQPWSPEEHAAGGIIECHPEDYVSRKNGDLRWVEHRRIFSLNPCLIPRNVFELGWPDGNEAEMTATLVDLGYRFAFLGERFDPPKVIHVGTERSAGWRL